MSRSGRAGGAWLRGTILAALAIASVSSAGAQESATLDQVDDLVAAGRTEDARAALSRWWEASGGAPGAAPRADLQRALWLRGVLTVDPTQAALDYQRLVVEHPGSAWSDQALLRLAQTSAARGDATKAREQLRALLRDYPGSSLRAEAERALAAVGNAAPPAQAPGQARAAASTAAAPGASDPRGPRPGAEPPVPAGQLVGSWTVQVGAFANPERARALRDLLVAEGIDARLVVVPGSPLLRVRAGRFEDEELAQSLRRGLAARGLDASVSSDADREEAAP